MTERYTPEIGQALYGQPWQAHEIPDWLEAFLNAIRQSLILVQGDSDDPFANSGASFRNDVFAVEAYSWDEDTDQPWNFKYGDLEVSWYKYFGRGTTVNRIPTYEEGVQMLTDCLESLRAMEDAAP